jgi:hypothetical protein
MNELQRPHFPKYNAAFKRARIELACGVVVRLVGIALLISFVIYISNMQLSLIIGILFLCAIGGVISLIDQTYDIVKTFDLIASSIGYDADPRAREAHELGFKAATQAALAGANSIGQQAAYDAEIAAFVDANPT